jgi:hypothetical protein
VYEIRLDCDADVIVLQRNSMVELLAIQVESLVFIVNSHRKVGKLSMLN